MEGHQERQKEEVRKPLGTGISLRCKHFWSGKDEENRMIFRQRSFQHLTFGRSFEGQQASVLQTAVNSGKSEANGSTGDFHVNCSRGLRPGCCLCCPGPISTAPSHPSPLPSAHSGHWKVEVRGPSWQTYHRLPGCWSLLASGFQH